MKKVFMDVSKSFNEDLKKINNKIKNGIETFHFEVNEKNEKTLKRIKGQNIHMKGLDNYEIATASSCKTSL